MGNGDWGLFASNYNFVITYIKKLKLLVLIKKTLFIIFGK